ncbi:MAG TPA: sensor histidine kinase [Ktedonobacteraceae bacterium]|nr:sensor histidine kinase [Ktedonobacteraceae bacterium]
MQQRWAIGRGNATRGMIIQFAGSYLLAEGGTLIVSHWLSMSDVSPVLMIALALACGTGIGLLATANILYGVFFLHLAQLRLAEKQSLNVSPSLWFWPLTPLFQALTQVGQKLDEAVQKEQQASEYRDQWLRQASESAALEERNRLARELHDSIKQQLFSIRMGAIAAKEYIHRSAARAQEAVEDILRSANEAQVEMQALLQHLRSAALERTTLAEAVQTQAQALEYRSGAQVLVEMTALPETERCPLPMQEAVFRIIQEAFANIARHARAQHVHCTITGDEQALAVLIQDDGQGFDLQHMRKGMGLENIQERARALHGTARIESAPGVGTTLCIQFPLLLSPEAKQRVEQQELEMQQAVERVQGGLQLRSTLSTVTLIALVIDLALFTSGAPVQIKELVLLMLGLCLLFLFSTLVSTHMAIARVLFYRGEQDRKTRSFRLYEHFGWTNFWRLFLLASWHVIFWDTFLTSKAIWWQMGIYVLLCVAFIAALSFFGHWRLNLAQERYYTLLSPRSLIREMKQRRRNLRWRIILSLCLSIPLLIHDPLALFRPDEGWHWLTIYMLLVVLVLGLGIIIEWHQLQFWRRQAVEKARMSKEVINV